jgi:hypothetical protein
MELFGVYLQVMAGPNFGNGVYDGVVISIICECHGNCG